MAIDDLTEWRDEFPILSRSVYMISNSLGAMPRRTADNLAEYAHTWATRGVRGWEDRWWEMAGEIGYAAHTKSSLMVGLGETREELHEAFEALREVDVDILTVGQYLRPSLKHLALERYYHPDEFAEMKVEALGLGFKHVESAPMVRSSYHARDQVPGAELKRLRRQATLDDSGRVVPLAG